MQNTSQIHHCELRIPIKHKREIEENIVAMRHLQQAAKQVRQLKQQLLLLIVGMVCLIIWSK